MPTIAVWPIDAERVVHCLEEAREKLNRADGEVVADLVLDFAAVRRLDSRVLRELEKLAVAAAEKSVKVALRGVNVEVYKVLKLTRLAPQFSFVI